MWRLCLHVVDVQAYIIPMHDKRYLTTYGGAEHPTCTTFARRFSARYTHATDAPPQVRAASPSAHNPQPPRCRGA